MGVKVPDMRFKCLYDAFEHLNILLYIFMEVLGGSQDFTKTNARPEASHVTAMHTEVATHIDITEY